jgi:uncharacterized radical SAM superfamily Fe-S cluster-containing enzyme
VVLGQRLFRTYHLLTLYFQFDGFDSETYRILRGEPDILEEKLRALDRLAEIGLNVTLVPAIERGANEHEVRLITTPSRLPHRH